MKSAMNFNGKSFAPVSTQSDTDSFMAKLMRQKGIQGDSSNPSNPKFEFKTSIKQESESEPESSVSATSYLERLRSSRVGGSVGSGIQAFTETKVSNPEPQIQVSSEDFIKQLALKKGLDSSTPTYASTLLAPVVKKEISQEEYIEQMKRIRDTSSDTNKITTLMYDFAKGNDVAPVISEEVLSKYKDTNESDNESDNNNESTEPANPVNPEDLVYNSVYTYAECETLKTTPSISKENMINFLNKQGANGGFNPVDAYNNTLSDSDKAQIKEETIRKNIGLEPLGSSKSANEKIIEELGPRRNALTKAEKRKLDQAEKDEKARRKMEKEVAKALKGPSKKVQDIIAKKDSGKEEKILTDDDNYLLKLEEELKAERIKSVYEAANWIVIISNFEKKMKGFELLFMGISEPILKKIIYIEIIRRVPIDSIESKKFKEAMVKFTRTFPTNELIKFQLKEMEDIIPPFSPFEKKKMCLDPWQIDVFKNINQKFSILIDAPTAAGKTVCATYCVTVCEKVLFVLPSKELANQVAGVIRNMKTPTTNFTPIKLITGENIYEDFNPKVFIGTAVDLERYFNLEKTRRIRKGEREISGDDQIDIDQFDYIIVDEIHQMNSPDQGCAMQRLIKRFKCPMLGLSATIGNPEQLESWIRYLKETTPNTEVRRVSYDKRFINQQKHVWDGKELVAIHPLSVITLEDLQSNKLVRTEMQFIPKDLFTLYDQMEKLYPREAILSVIPEAFFENACIGLNECKKYETVMKQLLTELSKTYPTETSQLLQHFFIGDIQLDTLGPKDLYHVLKQMQHSKKLPAIIFKFDPTTCKKVANDLLEWMELEELLKYPLYRQTRELQSERYRDMKTKIEAIDHINFGKSDDVKSDKLDREISVRETCLKEFIDEFKKLVGHNIHKYADELELADISEERRSRLEFYIAHYTKEMKDIDRMRELRDINVFAPHPDFTFSNVSICMSTMIEIKNLLKEYTEQIVSTAQINKKKLTNNFNIGYNHFFLRSIERGFVLYLNALPVPFQRIGQMLIADGGAPITFSDESLAFGVNYPIRSVGLLGSTSNDIIDKAKADQASGRSGRRGLDTKGHTIYIGVNWKDLTSSEYIRVSGANPDNEYMTLPHAFNAKFDVKRLSLVSLDEYCGINSDSNLDSQAQVQAIKDLQAERLQIMRDTHKDLIERLGLKNFMNVYRLSDYGSLSETIIDFLVFLSGKMYSGVTIDKYDLFEMIGCLVDKHTDEELVFASQNNANLMYEFQADMGEKGVMVELHGCNSLTRGYKKLSFEDNENISLAMTRLRHINEIIRILYNQTQSMSKTNKWVGLLLTIFDEIKNQIFKNTI